MRSYHAIIIHDLIHKLLTHLAQRSALQCLNLKMNMIMMFTVAVVMLLFSTQTTSAINCFQDDDDRDEFGNWSDCFCCKDNVLYQDWTDFQDRSCEALDNVVTRENGWHYWNNTILLSGPNAGNPCIYLK